MNRVDREDVGQIVEVIAEPIVNVEQRLECGFLLSSEIFWPQSGRGDRCIQVLEVLEQLRDTGHQTVKHDASWLANGPAIR